MQVCSLEQKISLTFAFKPTAMQNGKKLGQLKNIMWSGEKEMKEGWLDGCAILDQSLRVFAVVYSRGSPSIP